MPVRQPGRRFPRQARGKGSHVGLSPQRGNLFLQARRRNLCDRNDVETFRKVSPSALVDGETFLHFLLSGQKVSPVRWQRNLKRFRRRPGGFSAEGKGFAVGRVWCIGSTAKPLQKVSPSVESRDGETFCNLADGETFSKRFRRQTSPTAKPFPVHREKVSALD